MVAMTWSVAYRAAWDATPGRYVDEGIVEWGRSRRLGKFVDEALGLKAYVGVQHYDPGRWGVAGEARARFFLSLFADGGTVSLRTYATIGDALDALDSFRMRRRQALDR
jgi:hypothetical protein